jgi:DNA-binding transcriptional ArsR family regulator
MEPKKLNKIIHERVRLAVMSALAGRGKLTFSEMKQLLDVTDGNLSVHTAILEKNGLIAITKDFDGKKPRTTFTMTQKGKRVFKEYVNELEKIIKGEQIL